VIFVVIPLDTDFDFDPDTDPDFNPVEERRRMISPTIKYQKSSFGGRVTVPAV